MRKLLLILPLALPALSQAAEPDTIFTGELFFTPLNELDIEPSGGPNASPDGTGYGVRLQAGAELHLYGEYTEGLLDVSGTDVDTLDTRLGLGYRAHFDQGYLHASVEYARFEVEINNVEADDEGVGAHLGAGVNVAEQATVYGRVGIVALDDLDGPELRLGVSGQLSRNTGVFAEYRYLDLSDSDGDLTLNELRIGARLTF